MPIQEYDLAYPDTNGEPTSLATNVECALIAELSRGVQQDDKLKILPPKRRARYFNGTRILDPNAGDDGPLSPGQ